MPGRSFTRPPRIITIECSCRLCPTPGMYEVTSRPLVRRTRATLRSAEFGFFGVVVYTRMQTPRFWGHACIAGVFDFLRTASRPMRTSWLMVGMALRRRERRQNSDFITAMPRLVNIFHGFDHLGAALTSGHGDGVAFAHVLRRRLEREHAVERLHRLAAWCQHLHARV